MRPVSLIIDDTQYELDDSTDVSTLQQRLLAAASAAPAFVSFAPAGFADATVLITTHTRVAFHTPAETASAADWAGYVSDADVAFYDVDSFGYPSESGADEPGSGEPGPSAVANAS